LTDRLQTDRFSSYHEAKTPKRSSISEKRSELPVALVYVVELMPLRVVEIVPAAVVEIVPVRVVEIVPVRVVEMVPAFVVEMVPGLATAETDIANTKIPVQTIG
jgi:hypothetical protein